MWAGPPTQAGPPTPAKSSMRIRRGPRAAAMINEIVSLMGKGRYIHDMALGRQRWRANGPAKTIARTNTIDGGVMALGQTYIAAGATQETGAAIPVRIAIPGTATLALATGEVGS